MTTANEQIQRSLSDDEVKARIETYRAAEASGTRGGFLKYLKANNEVAGWHRVSALWVEVTGEQPVAKPEPVITPKGEVVSGPVAVVSAVAGGKVSESAAREALKTLTKEMNKAFPERRDVVDGAIAALVAAENVLLLGPPGTAKTKLIEVLADATGMTRFTHLMTQFTDPSEIFGGLDVAAAKVGVRRTITTGMLPEVQIGILDEIFKSNSAILNALLTIINERKFHNGSETMRTPLNSIFAASNEMPQTDDLAALFDRLFLRFEVDYLRSDANFLSVIEDGNPKPAIKLSQDVIAAAQAGASSVKVSAEAKAAILNIRTSLKAENIIVSDRRWVKAYNFSKSVAWIEGDSEVTPEHLGFLSDALWSDPDQRSTVKRIVSMNTNSVAAKALEITAAANEQVEAVKKLAAYDRGGALNAASQANTKIAAMIAKLDEMAKASTKRQAGAIDKAKAEVEAAKAAIVAIVKKG